MYSILLRDGLTNKAWPVMNAITDNSSQTAGEYKIKLLTMDRDYQKALLEVEKLLSGPSDKFLYKAAIHTSLNNSAAAQMHYDSAIVSLNKELSINSDHPQIHMNLASAFAGKGNSKKAIEEGNKAIELATAAGNNMIINDMKLIYLEVLIDVGEYEEAVELADYLLENPSLLSLRLLEHDPVFDPLRKRQDFKDIIKEHSLN
jgi:tetratricopeptide (TPR) repeat protein